MSQKKTNDPKRKKEQLEKERKKKEEEIRLTKKLLTQTTREKNKSINQLRLLNKQIKIREELIDAVSTEINSLDEQIRMKNDYIGELNSDLELRKKEYADMLFVAYKTKKSFHPVSFILAAENFNQAVKRLRFVSNLSEGRIRQMELIRETQERIVTEVKDLQAIRGEKTDLLGKQEDEKKNLVVDKEEENKLVKNLQSKEKDLRKELAAKQKAAKDLEAQIQRIIEEEIRRAREEEKKRLEAERKKGNTAPSAEKKEKEALMTPEATALSSSFNSNRGKLPWPVEKGFIIKSYGEHRHPTLPNVKTVNNGVDIVTTDGAQARAVFEGEVRAVFSIPGMQNAVMINHGEFFTVYTHLESVLVKKGDKVKIKQSLGRIYLDPEDAKTILHFELWKGSVKQDPELWIHGR